MPCSKLTDLAKELIPGPFNDFAVVVHNARKLGQFVTGHAIAVCQPYFRHQPELCFSLTLAYMDMQGLERVAFVRVEKSL
jgi:hypothetical protein